MIKKIKQTILDTFKNHLNNKIENKESVDSILNKGKKIIEKFEEIKSKKDKKFLLIGKVQSGKTVNFLSVIANAFNHDYRFIFVLTSIDTKLHTQTIERIKESFNSKENKNIFKIFDLNDKEKKKELEKNPKKILEEKEKLIIFAFLKNPKNLETINNIFANEQLNKEKVLIIDDEGDLASFSKDNKNKRMKTFESIKSLFNSLSNPAYISVTATPQVQFLTQREEEMIPRKVFCVEPGKGYIGLNNFANDKYYKIIDSKTNPESYLIFEAIFYYIICWSNYLYKYKKDQIWFNEHSNFLIHTDVKTQKHDDTKSEIDNFLEIIKNDFKNEEYKNSIIYDFKQIIRKYELEEYLQNDKYMEILEWCIERLTTKIINQKNNEELNSDFATIVIGSRMLERGITLDNLIVTYFTNRSERSKIAIDTLLQRARWFGYRNSILDYIKIFTTDKIKNDFKEIKKIDDSIWNILKNTEEEDGWFDEIDREIILKADSKLLPTSKVPLKLISSKNQSSLFINYLEEISLKFQNVFDRLKKSNEKILISKNNVFKCISFDNIDSFFKLFPELKDLLLELNSDFEKIKELKLKVCLLDNDGKPRNRSCEKLNEKYKIKQLFQGRSDKYCEGLEESEYVGDANWHKIKQYENDLFLQIHYLNVFDNNKNELTNSPIFAWSLLVPESISNKFEKYVPLEENN